MQKLIGKPTRLKESLKRLRARAQLMHKQQTIQEVQASLKHAQLTIKSAKSMAGRYALLLITNVVLYNCTKD